MCPNSSIISCLCLPLNIAAVRLCLGMENVAPWKAFVFPLKAVGTRSWRFLTSHMHKRIQVYTGRWWHTTWSFGMHPQVMRTLTASILWWINELSPMPKWISVAKWISVSNVFIVIATVNVFQNRRDGGRKSARLNCSRLFTPTFKEFSVHHLLVVHVTFSRSLTTIHAMPLFSW